MTKKRKLQMIREPLMILLNFISLFLTD